MDPEPFRVLLLRRLHMPLSLNVRAGVAVSLTSLATTAQRAAELGSWAKGGSLQNVLSLRRRRASVHQRHVAGLGHFPSTQFRRTTFGGGRRVVFVRRVPACFGCHRLHAPRRWNTQEEGGRGGWSCAERSKKPHTLSCVGVMVEHDLWSLLGRLPRLLQGSVRFGWCRRWCCLLACSTAKAVACSLVGHRGSPGSGDQVPSAHEVLTEAGHLV